jgi:hypothetical protein
MNSCHPHRPRPGPKITKGKARFDVRRRQGRGQISVELRTRSKGGHGWLAKLNEWRTSHTSPLAATVLLLPPPVRLLLMYAPPPFPLDALPWWAARSSFCWSLRLCDEMAAFNTLACWVAFLLSSSFSLSSAYLSTKHANQFGSKHRAEQRSRGRKDQEITYL